MSQLADEHDLGVRLLHVVPASDWEVQYLANAISIGVVVIVVIWIVFWVSRLHFWSAAHQSESLRRRLML